jgi:hypothetical protein
MLTGDISTSLRFSMEKAPSGIGVLERWGKTNINAPSLLLSFYQPRFGFRLHLNKFSYDAIIEPKNILTNLFSQVFTFNCGFNPALSLSGFAF